MRVLGLISFRKSFFVLWSPLSNGQYAAFLKGGGGVAQRFAGGRLSPGQNPWEPLADGAPDYAPSVELPGDNDPDALLLDQELKEPVGPGSGHRHKEEGKEDEEGGSDERGRRHPSPLLQHPQATRRTTASAQTTDRPYDRQTTIRPGSSSHGGQNMNGGNSRDFRGSRPRSAGTSRPPPSSQQQQGNCRTNNNNNNGGVGADGLAVGGGAGVDVTRAARGSGLGFAEVQWKGGAP